MLLCTVINEWGVTLPALTIFRSLPGHRHSRSRGLALRRRSLKDRYHWHARAVGGRGAERLGEPAVRSGARAVDLLLCRFLCVADRTPGAQCRGAPETAPGKLTAPGARWLSSFCSHRAGGARPGT